MSAATPSGSRFIGRLALVVLSIAAVVAGLPGLLLITADQRFGHASPLLGMKAPWHWAIDDLRSWGHHLTDGLDSSTALIDLFFRVALVIGWACAGVVIYTVVDELVFQIRHGMPSAHRRRFGGLGLIGRKLATVLVAVLPIALSATPTLAGPATARATVEIAIDRSTDLSDPGEAVLNLAQLDAVPSTSNTLGGEWSLVEVKRGDSIWAIAERVANGRGIDLVAEQIVAANLGTVMADGHRFSTPALIEPGWLLNVPVASAAADVPVAVDRHLELVSSGDDYVVVPGDSYWKIAEHHLDRSAGAGQVAALTTDLMDLNAPLLGYSDPRLIRPGDVLHLAPDVASVDLPEPVVVAPVEVPQVVVASSPPVVVDASVVVVPSTPLPPLAVPVVAVAVPAESATSAAPASPETDAAAAAISARWSDDGVPIERGLGAAVLLSGGALAVLGARRRQQLRSADVGARLQPPSEEEAETEMLLRSLSPTEQLARIDLALRSAAQDLARQHSRALAIEIADDGEIRLYTDRPALVVADNWTLDIDAGAWRLPASISLVDLVDGARRSNQPCPALIHIGESAGGSLFVDLEAVGVLSVDAPPDVAASIVRCAAASLAVSPFAESTRVFTVGLENQTRLGSANVESQDSLGDAVDAVRTALGSIATATGGSATTFALRAAGNGGEAWEPSVLLAIGATEPEDLASLATLAGGGGRGVGVMIDRPVVGSGAVLRAMAGEFVLEPLGRRVTPVGLSIVEVGAVEGLLHAATQPLVADVDRVLPLVRAASVEFEEREPALIVQVLGNVSVQTVDGQVVRFDRSKAQELVVWLSQHRRRPKRASARTALWDVAVRDATFSNVVSDARRAMAKVSTPPAGQEWLGRTMNEDLPLHDLVVSDSELLEERVLAARDLAPAAAIALLRPGVELIHGLPFAGTSYLWPDAEGLTSALVLLTTSAAAELASHYLALGEIEGVFWATGRGLQVLAGHEELIALRMRAHAHRGDLAGVRGEWDSYERAVNADTWTASEPSPKLIDLRRELLAPSLAS